MDNSTKKLLEECSVGCKMGIESMEQVQHHVTDAKIAATIEKSCSKHKELEEEISKILLRAGAAGERTGCYGIHIFVDDDRCKNDDRRR